MPSETTAFSTLVSAGAADMRNIANVEALDCWLGQLGQTLRESGPLGADSRAEKSRAWLASVARNWMLRQGELCSYDASQESLAAAPAWIRAATASGRPIQQLALSQAELSKFESILDWMNSADGPAISTHWSKISVAQAEAAELSWIGRMAKAAAKRDLEASDAAGTSFFCSGGELGSSLRWVNVFSQDSLDREGALMRHCVGSYAKDVAASRKTIYSLRNQDNKPLLTVEARGSRLHQLKAFANAPCPPELMSAVRLFASSFALLHEGSVIDVSHEIQDAGIIPVPGLGLAIRGQAPPRSWATWIDELFLHSSVEDPSPADNILPFLAAAGFSSLVSLALPSSSLRAAADATTQAAKHGNLETLDALLSFLSEAPPPNAIFCAVKHGHFECAKRLLAAGVPSENFEPLLAAAAGGGRVDILSLVLSSCVDLEPLLPGALIFAAAKSNADCIELLLAQGPKGSSVREALLVAAAHDNVDAIRLFLLAEGPRCDTWEALNTAVAHGASLECAKALLPQWRMQRKGSAAHSNGTPDLTPLLHAIGNGRCDLLSAMLPLYGSSIGSWSDHSAHELALFSLRSSQADALGLVLSHSGAALDAGAISSLKRSAEDLKCSDQNDEFSVVLEVMKSWLDVHEAANCRSARTGVASALQAR